MKVGDLVKWSFSEKAYYLAFGPGFSNLHLQRQSGIIIDKNQKYLFVLWQDGDLDCNLPCALEVLSEAG